MDDFPNRPAEHLIGKLVLAISGIEVVSNIGDDRVRALVFVGMLDGEYKDSNQLGSIGYVDS